MSWKKIINNKDIEILEVKTKGFYNAQVLIEKRTGPTWSITAEVLENVPMGFNTYRLKKSTYASTFSSAKNIASKYKNLIDNIINVGTKLR